MEQKVMVKQLVDMLLSQGCSLNEALDRVNRTDYCLTQGIQLTEEELGSDQSAKQFVTEFNGMHPLEMQLLEAEKDPVWHQAVAEIRREKQFLISGWQVFKSIRWMSLVYLLLLSVLVLITDMFVVPAFEDNFTLFGAELPYLTRLYFSTANLALLILGLIWLLGLGYLLSIDKIKRHIKSYRFIPNWVFRLPVFKAIALSVNQCILLSKLHFLAKLEKIELQQIVANTKYLDITENDLDYSQKQALLEQLKLAMELQLPREFIERKLTESIDVFVDESTNSMRILSLVGTITVGLIIASVIVAIYAPIFMFGAII